MLLELGVPQGRIVSKIQGGPDALSSMLASASNGQLSGYLKVVLSKERERSEGLISFNDGNPILAVYVFQPSGMKERWFLGDKAVGFLWEDSANPSSTATVHEDVDLGDLSSSLPQSKISKVAQPQSIASHKEQRRRSAQSKALGKWTEQEIKDEMDRKKTDEQEQGVYELILQYNRMKVHGTDIFSCSRCGGPLDAFGNCPKCAEEFAPGVKASMEKGTFESFVVGASNRFAAAASEAVAARPGQSYNPLAIEGGPGLGKTHLLQAMGHKLRRAHPKTKVLLAPSEALEAELEGGKGNLKALALVSDVLLIDDIQYFAGKEKAQEELLKVISQLLDQGKQVVVTCDRAPKDIPSFNPRLLSRFDGGLLVDVQPPEESVRFEVLKRRTAENDLSIPEEVLVFIAQNCTESIRQVEGGLNRIAAFSYLMHLDITIEMAREVLGIKQEVAKTPVILERGHSYLLEEDRPEKCYDIVLEKLDQGFKALIISRGNPSTLRQKIGSEEPQVLWLTEHESKAEKTIPPSLEKIILLIEEFMHEKGDSVLLIDDLQYLISSATFDGVIRFIRTLVDQISERPSIFILSINPDGLKSQERSILQREMEPVRAD